MSATRLFERLDQKPYKSNYFYVEAIIDGPIEEVWRRALKIGDWMTDHRLETIDGQPGKIAHLERVYPRDTDPSVPRPHYHLYAIAELIPLKCIALEVFPEKGGSYGDPSQWIAFDSILFSDLGGRTNVGFLQIHVVTEGEHHDDEAARQRRKKDEEIGRDRLNRYFENLRRLVRDS
jgi:hypothetical protein